MNGPGRNGYECIRSQKESTKQDIAHISHRIQSILQLFIFAIAPNLLILHTQKQSGGGVGGGGYFIKLLFVINN